MLFTICRARAGPLRAITVIGNAGNGVTAIDVEDRSGYVTGAIGSKEDARLNHVFWCFGL